MCCGEQEELWACQAWGVRCRNSSRPHHVTGVCKHRGKTPGVRRGPGSSEALFTRAMTKLQQQMGRITMNVNANYIHFFTGQRYVSNCGDKDNYVTLKISLGCGKKAVPGPLRTCMCIRRCGNKNLWLDPGLPELLPLSGGDAVLLLWEAWTMGILKHNPVLVLPWWVHITEKWATLSLKPRGKEVMNQPFCWKGLQEAGTRESSPTTETREELCRYTGYQRWVRKATWVPWRL